MREMNARKILECLKSIYGIPRTYLGYGIPRTYLGYKTKRLILPTGRHIRLYSVSETILVSNLFPPQQLSFFFHLHDLRKISQRLLCVAWMRPKNILELMHRFPWELDCLDVT